MLGLNKTDTKFLLIVVALTWDMTGGQMKPDEIVFDLKAGKSGESSEIAGGEALSDQEIQALWLRRVQTRPADFLRAKFAYQEALREAGGDR